MMMLAARIEGDPDRCRRPSRAIAVIDPGQPVFHVETLDQLVCDSLILRASAA